MSSDFDYTQFPYTFAHCLNSECLRAEQCLRQQVTLRMPKERGLVTVVNPNHVSPSGEDCKLFVLDQPEQYARGITHLLDRVPHNDAVFIKQQMIAHFGQTNYYRFFRKERLVKPHEQKYIRQLFQKRGVTEEPVFDEYVEYYDLQRKK